MLAQVVRVALTSPVLAVARVDVVGSDRLTSAEAIELGELPLGANVFLINLGQAARAMRSDPIIKDVRITRLPPATLLVKIVDRQPVLMVRAFGRLWEVDDGGLLYREALGPEPDLPAVRLPAELFPGVGKFVDERTWTAVNQCIDLASREQLVLRGVEITEKRELWVDLELDPGRGGGEASVIPVRLGRDESLPRKFREIRVSVLTWPSMARACRYLDVMSPGRPAFKTGERFAEAEGRAVIH